MLTKVDVIICTHNPNLDFLSRTISALKKQTLPVDKWQLLIIDNASTNSFHKSLDLSWHPQSKYIYENNLGLTHARLAGILAASSELIVFVDDDNLLAPDYLESAIRIADSMPYIGAFGGNLIPEYEQSPSIDITPYVGYLAVRTIARSVWSNKYDWSTTPAGAGMVIRHNIAKHYRQSAIERDNKLLLDRVGDSLSSCGDIDMAFTAIDMGYGCGLFSDLILTHIIPTARVEPAYILRLIEANVYSNEILRKLRPQTADNNKTFLAIPWWSRLKLRIKLSRFEYQVFEVKRMAELKLNKLSQYHDGI